MHRKAIFSCSAAPRHLLFWHFTLADHQALPTLTLLLDKWIDGAPELNDFFGLKHEHDYKETQLRAGGDVKGLASDRSLDYLQGMGYQCVYIAGTFFLNMPWQADSESRVSPARATGR